MTRLDEGDACKKRTEQKNNESAMCSRHFSCSAVRSLPGNMVDPEHQHHLYLTGHEQTNKNSSIGLTVEVQQPEAVPISNYKFYNYK